MALIHPDYRPSPRPRGIAALVEARRLPEDECTITIFASIPKKGAATRSSTSPIVAAASVVRADNGPHYDVRSAGFRAGRRQSTVAFRMQTDRSRSHVGDEVDGVE